MCTRKVIVVVASLVFSSLARAEEWDEPYPGATPPSQLAPPPPVWLPPPRPVEPPAQRVGAPVLIVLGHVAQFIGVSLMVPALLEGRRRESSAMMLNAGLALVVVGNGVEAWGWGIGFRAARRSERVTVGVAGLGARATF